METRTLFQVAYLVNVLDDAALSVSTLVANGQWMHLAAADAGAMVVFHAASRRAPLAPHTSHPALFATHRTPPT